MSAGRKQMGQHCHKLVVLADLMLETIDDLTPFLGESVEMTQACNIMKEECMGLLESIYGIEEVRKSTYMGELSKKVDTCIRKNFIPVGSPNKQ